MTQNRRSPYSWLLLFGAAIFILARAWATDCGPNYKEPDCKGGQVPNDGPCPTGCHCPSNAPDWDDKTKTCVSNPCPCGSTGGSCSSLGCLYTRFNLGKQAGQGFAGYLYVLEDYPKPDLASPQLLKISKISAGTQIRYEGTQIRQVLTDQTLADIQTESPYSYTIDFYYQSQIQGPSSGLYQPPPLSYAFARWRIENPDGSNAYNRLTITRLGGEQTNNICAFTWDASNRQWRLDRNTGGEYLYTADILANGTSPDSAAIPGGDALFSASYVGSNSLPSGTELGLPALVPHGDYSVEIDTPIGLYRTGPKTLPDSGLGSNQDMNVFYSLIGDTPAESPVARKEIQIYTDTQGRTNKIVQRLYDLTLTRFYLPILEITDPEGAALTLVRTFYNDPYDKARFGRLATEVQPDGSWVSFGYDVLGRKSLELRTWLDAGCSNGIPSSNEVSATYYRYESVDPRDTPSIRVTEPRTVEKIVMGHVVERTWHAYYTESNGLVSVTEKAVSPDGSYGDTENQRNVTVAFDGDDRYKGLPIRLEKADGTMETYSYEEGSYSPSIGTLGTFTESPGGPFLQQAVVYGTLSAPAGIVGKTRKVIRVLDQFQNVHQEVVYLLTDAGYELADWTVREYDDLDRETAAYFQNGLSKHMAWETCCNQSMEAGTDGTIVHNVYDTEGRVVQKIVEGAEGGIYPAQPDRVTTYARDGVGNVLTETASAGGLSLVVSNEYDLAGRLVSTVDAAGLVTTYSYQDGGRITTVTRPGGATEMTEKYLDGRIKSVTGTGVTPRFYECGVNADGSQWTKVYTGSSNSPAWEKTVTDMLGRTVRIEKPAFGGSQSFVSEFQYNPQGQLIRAQETGSRDLLNEYDELGSLVRSGVDVDGDGSLDLASMDRIRGTETQYMQISNVWWQETKQMVYPVDNSGSIVTTAVQRTMIGGFGCGCQAQEKVSTDVAGNQTVSTVSIDRENKTTTRTILYADSTNAAVEITVNDLVQSSRTKTGVETTFLYDALGRRVHVESSGGSRSVATVTHYNDQGLMDYAEDAAGNRTSYTYDSDTGRRIAVTDALSNTVYTAYDLQGRVTNTAGATYPVAYAYDVLGRTIQMKTWRDENGSPDVTAWQYDEATGLLTNKLYADGNGVAYTYDAAGRLASRTWARGVITDYEYDLLGQLTGIDYSDATPDVTFAYDRLGRQVTITDALGTRTNIYDSVTLALKEEQLADGTAVARAYDPLGRPTGISLGTDYSVTYGYDNIGRFSFISSSVQSASSAVAYSYVPDSDLLAGYTLTPGGSASPLTVSRSYEQHRNLISALTNAWDGTPVSAFDYAYDAIGRRTRRVDSAYVTNVFGYNIQSELTEALMGTNEYGYAYDPVGNREWSQVNLKTNDYIANELNQYLSVSSITSVVSLSYDPDGNLTNDGARAYIWDAENRLILVEWGTNVVENAYDYMSRRVEKIANGAARRFVYDGWNLIRETQVSGLNTQISYFVWGQDLSGTLQGAGGVGGLLAVSRDGVMYFTAYDGNGNVTDYVDTNGAVVAHREYDPFGETIVATGAMKNEFSHRFSTKYTDPETGMCYYGYRYYSPQLGRWLSRDPIGEVGGPGWDTLQRSRFNADEFWVQRARSLEQECREIVSSQGVLDLEVIAQIAVLVQQQIEIERQYAQEQLADQITVFPFYLFVANNPINLTDFIGLSVVPPCTAWSGSGFWCHRFCFKGSFDPKTGEWSITGYIELAPCCHVR